jgi:diguanylate cyclase (GGDEF)-like protein/putative nucleotidyltransferase with HDIG domain
MPIRAKAFVALMVTAGVIEMAFAFAHWHCSDLVKFGCYLLIGILASTMKVKLPGMDSTMSVYFLVVLLGVLELSLAETMVIGFSAALVQSFAKNSRRSEIVKVAFNLFGLMGNAIFLTHLAHHASARLFGNNVPLVLLSVALAFFLSNTLPLAMVIALAEGGSMRKMWMETYVWGLPYNLAGAGLVGVIRFAHQYLGWQNSLLILPIMYGIYRAYRLYLDRLEDQRKRTEIEELQVQAERRHVEQVCALHLRTIESLALAIDAKDHTTHQHLHRVRTYAVEIARELDLTAEEMDALRAAALLHDIGKLAVPDHIINKPGRLTPEEFEKMKIHPLVGADILEQVEFPYPVAPIVRSHHEKWNGNGYPDGLVGEQIPIGARILAVVDALDAIASDRQYRKALSLDDAMRLVASESGCSYDPRVVDILQRRYRELEDRAVRSLAESRSQGRNVRHKVQRGDQPAAGFEVAGTGMRATEADFLSSIASARHEAHTLFELSQDLGNSLSLDETLSLVGVRLRKLVPYDSIVVFVKKGDILVPEFVSGDNYRRLSSLRIPIGTGLCGWVAQNVKPILNGNPQVEQGLETAPRAGAELRSALAVPLEGLNGLVGVFALYQDEENAFSSDHLRVLQVITSKVALFIENALKYRQAETSATSDYLTGLPNARALSLRLEEELARCRRENSNLAVIVCDLNGFKLVNDRFGHLAGDNVLRQFAESLRNLCRKYDFAARMGGDEFVILAPNMTSEAVSERAILLSTLARKAGKDVCGEDHLSLSLGAAFYPRHGTTAEQLLAEADRKMYAAKKKHYSFTAPVSGVLNGLGDCMTIN